LIQLVRPFRFIFPKKLNAYITDKEIKHMETNNISKSKLLIFVK